MDVTVWAPRRRARAPLRIGGPLRAVGAQMRFTLGRVRTRLPGSPGASAPYGWPDLQVVLTDAAGMEHTGLIMTPPDDIVDHATSWRTSGGTR